MVSDVGFLQTLLNNFHKEVLGALKDKELAVMNMRKDYAVPHKILLEELYNVDICGSTLRCFDTYLSYKTLLVKCVIMFPGL